MNPTDEEAPTESSLVPPKTEDVVPTTQDVVPITQEAGVISQIVEDQNVKNKELTPKATKWTKKQSLIVVGVFVALLAIILIVTLSVVLTRDGDNSYDSSSFIDVNNIDNENTNGKVCSNSLDFCYSDSACCSGLCLYSWLFGVFYCN